MSAREDLDAVLEPSGTVTLGVSLENRSDREGVEVVQLYLRQTIPGVTIPAKRLLKFERVAVPIGQTVDVSFALSADDFVVWDKHFKRRPYEGEVELMVGRSSRAEDLQIVTLACPSRDCGKKIKVGI